VGPGQADDRAVVEVGRREVHLRSPPLDEASVVDDLCESEAGLVLEGLGVPEQKQMAETVDYDKVVGPVQKGAGRIGLATDVPEASVDGARLRRSIVLIVKEKPVGLSISGARDRRPVAETEGVLDLEEAGPYRGNRGHARTHDASEGPPVAMKRIEEQLVRSPEAIEDLGEEAAQGERRWHGGS
jgi:hypothetical protein